MRNTKLKWCLKLPPVLALLCLPASAAPDYAGHIVDQGHDPGANHAYVCVAIPGGAIIQLPLCPGKPTIRAERRNLNGYYTFRQDRAASMSGCIRKWSKPTGVRFLGRGGHPPPPQTLGPDCQPFDPFMDDAGTERIGTQGFRRNWAKIQDIFRILVEVVEACRRGAEIDPPADPPGDPGVEALSVPERCDLSPELRERVSFVVGLLVAAEASQRATHDPKGQPPHYGLAEALEALKNLETTGDDR